MEDLLVSLACQLIVSKTELKIVVQKTQNRRSATTFSQKTSLAEPEPEPERLPEQGEERS